MAYMSPTKTWGFEVIRALDSNDVARALRAFKIPGAHVDAKVEDSYGFYKWPWMHRYYGGTVVHLAIEWKRENILRALLTLKPRLDIRNGKHQLAADLCVARLGLPLEQIVAEEEARWTADCEAAEAERLRMEALERYNRRMRELHDRASGHCLAEAKELLMKGCVKGRVYFDPSSSKHKQAARFGAGPLETSCLSRLLIRLDGLSSLSTRDHLRYEVLDDERARALAQALTHNATITSLSLARSRFTSSGLQSLLAALAPHSNSSNQQGDEHAPSLLPRMPSPLPRNENENETKPRTRLQTLDLSHTHLSDQGAALLYHFLSSSPSPSSSPQGLCLETLVLDHNRLSDRGALALVQASLNAPSMRRLRMAHNDTMTDKGRRAIENALANAARKDPAYARLRVVTMAGKPLPLPSMHMHVVKRLSLPPPGHATTPPAPEAEDKKKSPAQQQMDPFFSPTAGSLRDSSPFSTPRNSEAMPRNSDNGQGACASSPYLRPESRGEAVLRVGQGPRGGLAMIE